MKRILLLITICVSLFSFGQIYQNDTTICAGDSILISILSTNDCGSHDPSLDLGLSGWYPLCSNADDLSSNINNGVLNGVTPTLDYFNNQNSAYSFNGVNNTIDLPNPFLGGSQVNAFTVNARIKFNDLSNSPNIWGKTRFWGEVNFAVLSTGEVQFWWANSITGNKYSRIKTVNSVILPGQWYDITVVFQNGTGQIYIDAQPVSTSLLWTAQGGATLSTTSIENSCNFDQQANSSKFGVRNSGGSLVGYLNGTLDEFKIWNYALNQALITQNYNSGGSATTVWSNGIINEDSIFVQPIQTTTYTVTVNSSNTSYTDSITIIVSNPQVDAGLDVDVCNGNDITLLGTGADTYTWAGAVTDGVAFGPTVSEYYYVTGTDTLGCEDNDSVFVTVLQPTNSSITASNCDSYTAPDGQTYTSTGNYTAVIPNAVGCDSTINIDLTITNSNSSSETVTECNSYTWSTNGQTYTQSGQYTEVLTNQNGCDSTVTLNLTIETVDITTQPVDQTVVVGNNGQFTVTTSATNPTYQWQMNDGTGWTDLFNAGQYSGTDTDVLTISNVQFGQNNFLYRCIVTSGNCEATSSVGRLTVQDNVGLDDINNNIFNVYPNPTSNSFTISSEKVINSEFKIIDSQGREVLTGSMNGQEHTIDISKLSKGVYSVVFDNTEYPMVSVIKE